MASMPDGCCNAAIRIQMRCRELGISTLAFLPEHEIDCLPLLIGKQVPIPANHLLRLMAHPFGYKPLIDSRSSEQ